MTLLLALGLVGGLRAIACFLRDGAFSERADRPVPAGTFAVNISGALVLAVVVGTALQGDALALVGTGAIGFYTAFSTWMLEVRRAAEECTYRVAAHNVGASLVVCLGAACVGRERGALR
jgi:fluoride exporter